MGAPQLVADLQKTAGQAVDDLPPKIDFLQESGMHITAGNLVGLGMVGLATICDRWQRSYQGALVTASTAGLFNITALEVFREGGLQRDWVADTAALTVAAVVTKIWVEAGEQPTISPAQQ